MAKVGKAFEGVLEVVKKLRGPNGCPWDRKQTPQTLKKYLIEEAYEAYEAIERESPEEVKEELGDLLFLILMIAYIYEEKGVFSVEQLLEASKAKMIRRHPHVFGEERVRDAEEVLKQWKKIKEQEGKTKGASSLGELPKSLPALQKAFRIGERAERVGFDWSNPQEVLTKLEEEMEELKEALKSGSLNHIKEEIGDFLFTVANLSRKLGINPEEALRHSLDKFCERFFEMERYFRSMGKDLSSVTLEEMDAVWERLKKKG